jgi:hypothetical protein
MILIHKSFPKLILSLLLIVGIYGCKTPTPELKQNPVATKTSSATSQNQDEKIKFKSEAGTELFSLKFQPDAGKLVDAKNQEIVKVKQEQSGKFKIKNPSEKTLGYVTTSKGIWQLENSDKNKQSYILKLENNGSYKLEDAAKKEIYQITKKNKDLIINANNQKELYQVKIKPDKTSLRDASGKTVFSTKSKILPIAFACFGFDVLTREQQAALAYAVNSTGGK